MERSLLRSQTEMYADIAELLRRLGLWFLSNVPANADLADAVALYRAGVEALRGTYASLVSEYELQDSMACIKKLMDVGVPEDLAHDVSALPLWSTAPEIAQLAHARNLDVDLVAGAYFAVGTLLGLDRLRGLRIAYRRGGALGPSRHPPHRRRSVQQPACVDGTGARSGQWQYAAAAAQTASRLPTAGPRRMPTSLPVREIFSASWSVRGDLSIAKLTLANSQIRELAAS